MFQRTLLAAALALASATAFADPVTYGLDPAHTNVVASWNHLGFSHPVMHFGDAEGTLIYDAEDVGRPGVVTRVTRALPYASAAFHRMKPPWPMKPPRPRWTTSTT